MGCSEEERQRRGVRLERGDLGEVLEDPGETEEVVWCVGEVVDCDVSVRAGARM